MLPDDGARMPPILCVGRHDTEVTPADMIDVIMQMLRGALQPSGLQLA
jgi:hypothetical protein